jgi:ketosteroid isomerase-like protein
MVNTAGQGLSDLAARLRHVYQSFFAGDVGPMRDFLSAAVVYHLPGRHLGGGTLHGRDAVFRRTMEAAQECDEPPRMQLLEVAAAGNFVVSIERFTARRAGRTLDQAVSVVWRIEDDRCVEMWSHFADQEACDAFWLR